MIVSIQPVTVGDVTTETAIVNLAVGEASVAVSLFPAVEVDGVWVKVEGAPVLPVVGADSDSDVAGFLAAVAPELEALVSGRGL